MKLDRDAARYGVVALLGLLAFVLGLYALTPVGDRAELLSRVGGVLVPLVAAAGTAITARVAGKAHAEAKAQTPVIEKIQRQTNGELTDRINDAIGGALDARGITLPDAAPPAELPALDDAGPTPAEFQLPPLPTA